MKLSMQHWGIFKRLILGYLVILLVVIPLGVYSVLKLGQLSRITRSISSIDSETISNANRLIDSVYSQRSFDKKYIVSEDMDFHLQFLEVEKYVRKGTQILPEPQLAGAHLRDPSLLVRAVLGQRRI